MDSAVVVVGAGPTGLMLAGELRLAGVPVIVLERLGEPTGQSRALGLTVRTMEVFDQRGLLERLGEVPTNPMGHFGGLLVDFSGLDSSHRTAHSIPQGRTERMLGDWAAGLGADIRRGHEVVAITPDAYGVDLAVRGPDGSSLRLRASYVVGCDGGRSTVRKLGGFGFPGTPGSMEMLLADVRGCEIEAHPFGKRYPGGIAMSAPLGDGIQRVILREHGAAPRTEPAGFEDVAAAWQRVTGQDIGHAEPVWASSFSDAGRLAASYRRGRVLLAGDAAHIHLPAGGQGMNVGIQDAVNLGWKLAAQVSGWAPPGLLDTYHRERHPVGERLLLNTRAQGLLFLGGDEVQPLREVFGELIAHPDVARHLAHMVTGLEIAYDCGPGTHPLLGRRLPHQELTGEADTKTSTTELLRAGRGLLLDLAGSAELRRIASAWHGRVEVFTGRPHAPGEDSPFAGTDALLVRPDGHVAWAAGQDDLPRALHRWFGAPR
ncbi:FAD-dependent monooxygenase [Streptomyces sp. NPDC007369]|uniref:FAD-dependent monooxygenase n=1 Tax=Streptomyces sp. NPDC007369 TaxID=3154589 RepID=UPI0033F41F2E